MLHQIQVFISWRLLHQKSILSIRWLSDLPRKRMKHFDQIVQCISFYYFNMVLWYFKCPLENVLLTHWRVKSSNYSFCIKLYQTVDNRIIVISKPCLKILLSWEDIVDIFDFPIFKWLFLKRDHLFVLGLII